MAQDRTIIIDTPEGIQTVRLLACIHALALEINIPGMKMSRGVSPLKAAQVSGWTKSRTKVVALRDCVEVMETVNPDYMPSNNVLGAMGLL
jgi:hypothetical protein